MNHDISTWRNAKLFCAFLSFSDILFQEVCNNRMNLKISSLLLRKVKIYLDTSWLFGYMAKYDKGGRAMKSSIKPQYEARAAIIKAMAHPSRLLIIEELNKNERCVGELTDMIGADTSTVSKHLSVLKNAGLVTDEKRANCIYYSLRCPCIMNFIGCVEDVLTAKAEDHKIIMKSCRK
jgi:ArsR family transcriptional regulator